MSEQTAQEPTMEEILASIRRIISEDDAPPAAEAAAPVEAPAVVMAAPAPAPVEPEDDDVLELTETVDAGAFETVGDLDVYTPAKAAPEPVWEPEPEPEPEPVFAAAPEPAPAPAPSYTMGAASFSGGTTIEELVRSILEPKLNEWADQNLPRLVEQIVRDKLSR
jgi:cell pole-organizing protein PopZ